MTLGARLRETAGACPRRTALVFGGRKYTYRELDAGSDALARGLLARGVAPGERVALLLPNCPEFVMAYFGAAKAGAAVVPINTFLAPPEIAHILKDSGARCVICSDTLYEKLGPAAGRPPGLRHIFVSGRPVPGATPFTELTGYPGADAPLPQPGEDDTAAVVYTSGTTGSPKGAMLTHRNLLSNADAAVGMFGVTKKDRFLLFLPMFHSFTSLVCVLLPLTNGCRVIILPSVRPFSRVIKAVVFGRASFFVAIPPVYALLSAKRFPRLVFRMLALRLCVSGAAPLPAEVLRRFSENFPVPLLEGYGLTEASPVVSCNPLHGARKPGSVGLPLPGVAVRVVGPDGSELPRGAVGEITVKGASVMKGYLGDVQATIEAVRDGWLFTGDLGYMDGDGYIFIVDRKKDLIISHGMNIYPREVEEALHGHPAVRQAAVVGIPDPSHGEVVKAFISLNDGASLNEREVKEFLKDRIARYKVPRQVEFRDALPMTPTGKVLKRELRAG